MKSLVTGGAGFIGSHLCEALLARGDEVISIDNLTTGRLDNINHLVDEKKFTCIVDSIMNEDVIDDLVAGCDEVYHLAAAVGVKLIMDKPMETIETNVLGTNVALKCANRHKKKIFIASTSEIYGNHKDESLDEDAYRIMGPVSKRRWAYACSKSLDEFLALAYYHEKKLPVVLGRLFNTVGPRQTGQYGMVLPNFVQSALLEKPIVVYGDGTQSRCFTYVSDTVRAILGLMKNKDAVGDVFNIGNEEEITIKDLAHKVKKLTNSSSSIEYISYEQAYGPGFEDMPRRQPQISKIGKLIGYKPEVNLDGIIANVIDYFRS